MKFSESPAVYTQVSPLLDAAPEEPVSVNCVPSLYPECHHRGLAVSLPEQREDFLGNALLQTHGRQSDGVSCCRSPLQCGGRRWFLCRRELLA